MNKDNKEITKQPQTRILLTGEKLIKKIDTLGINDIRELAIKCGYYSDYYREGKKVIRPLLKQFKEAVTDVGINPEEFVSDPYERQKKYSKTHRSKCRKNHREWCDEHPERVKHYRTVHKDTNRIAALRAYHKRKEYEKALVDAGIL